MSQITINVNSSTITQTVSKVIISNVNVILNTSATCTASQYDSNNNLIKSQLVQITPQQYALWSTQDSYFINCVLTNLGLTQVTS